MSNPNDPGTGVDPSEGAVDPSEDEGTQGETSEAGSQSSAAPETDPVDPSENAAPDTDPVDPSENTTA